MRRPPRTRRAGLTLLELIIATGLATLVMTALFRLLDVTLDLWAEGETRRAVVERGTATAELVARDLRSLHPGSQGDLLVDWRPFDVDGDGSIDRLWPRMRLVRQASRADLARLAAERLDPELVARAREEGLALEDVLPEGVELEPPPASGLTVVAYAVLPAVHPEEGRSEEGRFEGVLLRGEELLEPGGFGSFFEEDFFSASGQPRAGAMREVTGGILWMGLQFATQTTIVWDGWRLGTDLEHASASWDAWNLGRPDQEDHYFNEPGAGMPAAGGSALLPRRVRIELEFEGVRERRRRTRLLGAIGAQASSLVVENGEVLPTRAGRYLLIDGEWMELRSVRGDRVTVRRGARGTEARQHVAGALLHWGEPVVVEVPIPTYSEDWNLGALR